MKAIIVFYFYFFVAWVINLIQFLACDFSEPYREEIIKGIGVIIAPAAGITVWF